MLYRLKKKFTVDKISWNPNMGFLRGMTLYVPPEFIQNSSLGSHFEVTDRGIPTQVGIWLVDMTWCEPAKDYQKFFNSL